MISHNNLADYKDPVLYDLENQEAGEAGVFYLALAQKFGGPVLDLGCGTGRTIRVSGSDDYDAVNQVHHETAVRRWRDAQGNLVEQVAPLAQRRYFPQELETLLHYNGFTVGERYGDWDFSPLTSESPMLLYICRLSRGA